MSLSPKTDVIPKQTNRPFTQYTIKIHKLLGMKKK